MGESKSEKYRGKVMKNEDKKWLDWAIELQSLAQAGLTYGKDAYDREMYQRIREISAEILACKTKGQIFLTRGKYFW